MCQHASSHGGFRSGFRRLGTNGRQRRSQELLRENPRNVSDAFHP
jgi:hypothetical protein